MYKCPKCKQLLVSELDLANGIEGTIGYFIDNGIRVGLSASFRGPYLCCKNKHCKCYVYRNALLPYYFRINYLGFLEPVGFVNRLLHGLHIK